MRVRLVLPGVALLVTTGGCAGSQAPVPLVGPQADISRLTGEWFGEYSSTESGRNGSIVFKLTAGADTATGDVVMTPRMPQRSVSGQPPVQGQQVPMTQALTIRFVRVAGGEVSGALAPYTDPTCGCTLHTTFVGRLRADTLQGTYASVHEQTRNVQHGEWRVVRQHP
jgi:hypothetical protein